MKTFFYMLAALLLLPCVAHAEMATPTQNCPMQETGAISFNLNGTESDITKIKSLIDAKIEEVKAVAAEAKISDINLNNYSYNTSPINNGNCGATNPASSLQYNASFTFEVKEANKASELATLLISKGHNVTLNVNAYKQCDSDYAN
jgi:hypothetical protein